MGVRCLQVVGTWKLNYSISSPFEAGYCREINMQQLKGPIPSILVVHFTSNQKPMTPRTHFHCITTWVARSSG